MPRPPRNNVPIRGAGGAGDDFSVVLSDALSKCLVFSPPNRQASMCIRLVRRIAFQIRNAKKKGKKVQFLKYNGSQVELFCSARFEIVADGC